MDPWVRDNIYSPEDFRRVKRLKKFIVLHSILNYDDVTPVIKCINFLFMRVAVSHNPFQYKKGFSKVNSLFCTVKAIYDRVVFHI